MRGSGGGGEFDGATGGQGGSGGTEVAGSGGDTSGAGGSGTAGEGGHITGSGGAGGSAAGGYAGAADEPVGPLPESTKVDMLFMIDNSASMADKQGILAQAIPEFVSRLVDPLCVATDGAQGVPAANGDCPVNTHREFRALTDIHIGIISSSLGGHGAGSAGDGSRPEAHNMDMAHLLTRGAAAVPPLGFLNWDGNARTTGLTENFTAMVRGMGQHGCGYEAQLESIYRFLVDPEPYVHSERSRPASARLAAQTGIDTELLTQRKAFLRPDSIVVVVEVTDENDCSVIDGLQNFYVSRPPVTDNGVKHSALAHGTSQCLTNPSDVAATTATR